MNNRDQLIKALANYKTTFEGEAPFLPSFLDLLKHPRCFHRDHLPGHITGSAWIVNENKNFALLTHHAKLNRWLQPGGHADGDEDVLNVARREAEEETGLKKFRIHPQIFDIDIHTIPARKDFPEHLHYDIRILLEASMEDEVVTSEESHHVEWVPFNELEKRTASNESILRMREKVKMLFRSDQ